MSRPDSPSRLDAAEHALGRSRRRARGRARCPREPWQRRRRNRGMRYITITCGSPIALAIFVLWAGTSATGQGPSGKVVEIAVGDNMRYTPSAIDAEPGQRLRVILKAEGKIPALAHNFVLLKRGTNPKRFVDKATAAAGETGDIPSAMADQVIVAAPLVKSSATGEVTFEAPKEPGEYTFLCTFPGHFNLGMRGRLIVK